MVISNGQQASEHSRNHGHSACEREHRPPGGTMLNAPTKPVAVALCWLYVPLQMAPVVEIAASVASLVDRSTPPTCVLIKEQPETGRFGPGSERERFLLITTCTQQQLMLLIPGF